MNIPSSGAAPQEAERPVLREPDALVENIYPIPGTGSMPDLESQDVMAEYLISRFLPDEGPKVRVVMTPSGFTLPAIERVPNGFKEVSRWRKTQEWLVSPKVATVVTLGSLVLFNIAGNRGTIGGGVEAAGHGVYRIFNPVEDQVSQEKMTVVTPGEVRTINVTAATNNRVGLSTVDPIIIQKFIADVQQADQQGATIREISIIGNTSDEWGGDKSIGVADPENQKLGLDRAEAAKEELVAAGVVMDEAKLKISELEHVLSPEEKNSLLTMAQSEGFGSIKEAIEAIDNGQTMSPELAQEIQRYITGIEDRGVSITAVVETPGKETTTTTTIEHRTPGKDDPPEVPDPGFYGFIPLPPIRRRERYGKIKEVSRWQFTSSKRLYRPAIIKEDQDQAWVRLRPEALNKDGTLVGDAWAYTRKYEHLLRDGRIADMLRADFKNSKGESKSLRVMFIDQAPAQETINAFEELLKKFASMEEGKLGDRVSGIFIYPSENTGIEHDDPKRIAMGIDKQSSTEIFGTFTYALDLVELHMPSTWDPDELHEMFEAFNGPAWTASHEVAGHGTDETDATLHLRRVRTRNIPNAHLIDGEPRARKMSALRKLLRRLPTHSSRKNHPIEFDITYPVVDNSGRIVTMQARVLENDPRLAHASHSTIVGYQPTEYSGESTSEHYAETAASVTTGIAVPYAEAQVSVPLLQNDDGGAAVFAQGYRPDARGQKIFTDSAGAESGVFPVEFSQPAGVTISHINPGNDPLIQREMARTTRLRTLYSNQMIAILARIARTKGR